MSLISRSNKQKADLERTLEKILLAEQQLRDHLTARFSEVDSKNAILDQSRTQLENLLKTALSVDTFVDFDSLKVQARLPSFKRKEPILQRYLPAPLSGLGSWLPWKKRAYDKACTSAESKYKQDCEIYRETLFNHKKQVSQIRAEAEKHNEEIEQFQENFAAGEAQAVIRYFNLVLTTSEYPAGFSKNAKLAYFPESRLLKISYEMPAMHIISEIKAYKYAKSRDEITETVLPQKQRRQFYSSVLAKTCLRTIYEIFTADRTEKIEHIVFDGYVDAINPSTGNPGRFRLIALNVRREHFLSLNLEQVEPLACLKDLNARLSSKPDQLLAVPLIAQDDAQGAAVSDAAYILSLKQHVSELESKVQSQGIQIAEFESSLAAQKEENVTLKAQLRGKQSDITKYERRIRAHKDEIDKLEAKLTEDPKDTKPVESVKEKVEKSAIVELESKIQLQGIQITELESSLGAQREVNATLKAKLRGKQSAITKYERQIKAHKDEIGNEIQEQQKRNAALENELSDKRDRIAELVSDLRDEQERTAVLSATIHAQKDNIAELEVKPSEEPGDTQLAEAITEKAEESAIVEAEMFAPIDIGNSEDDSGGARIPQREAEADEPVTLRSLLVGPASEIGETERDENAKEETIRARNNGAENTTAAPGFLQRPDNTPADLLTDLEVVAHIMGTNDSETAQLLAQMMKHDWQCPPSVLESAFKGQFVNLIFEEINERAHDNIDENVIFDEDGQWVIHEDYRDEIEYIITHKEYLESKNAAR